MKHIVLLLLFSYRILSVTAHDFCNVIVKEEIKNIADHSYRFITSTNEEVDIDWYCLRVYREKDTIPCFTTELESIWGDSNSRSIRLATYELSDSLITLYHYWTKHGDAPVSPFGARKQIFTITDSGVWTLREGKITIETMTPLYIHQYGGIENNGYHAGAQFMRQPPHTEEEHELLRIYSEGVLNEYDATLVTDPVQMKLLLEEVREKVAPLWKGWMDFRFYCVFPFCPSDSLFPYLIDKDNMTWLTYLKWAECVPEYIIVNTQRIEIGRHSYPQLLKWEKMNQSSTNAYYSLILYDGENKQYNVYSQNMPILFTAESEENHPLPTSIWEYEGDMNDNLFYEELMTLLEYIR